MQRQSLRLPGPQLLMHMKNNIEYSFFPLNSFTSAKEDLGSGTFCLYLILLHPLLLVAIQAMPGENACSPFKNTRASAVAEPCQGLRAACAGLFRSQQVDGGFFLQGSSKKGLISKNRSSLSKTGFALDIATQANRSLWRIALSGLHFPLIRLPSNKYQRGPFLCSS